MAVTKRKLSGSTDGRGVLITGTTATGTLIHTAATGTTTFDEIYAWAVNTATVDRKFTLEWGRSTGNVGQKVELTVPMQDGPYLVVPGWVLQNARQVRGFAAAASVITVYGFVNRIA